jgi:6-phosphogluconolactonase
MDIKQFIPSVWALESAVLIQQRINDTLVECGDCSVMLTGGRSAERLYLSWAELSAFSRMKKVRFYFGDERCVLP